MLQVFLWTSANAFAHSGPVLDLASVPGEYLVANQNKKAVLFQEFTAGLDLRITSEDENKTSSTNSFLHYAFPTESPIKNEGIFSEFEINGKQLLKTQIFPFHFFW
ncbi:hypothetical protein GCM10023164_03080 [Christiangramia aestuarii]